MKRFRRSAADFKLDIPELVRPPAVLERVCGYLEEWVMVRTVLAIWPTASACGVVSARGFSADTSDDLCNTEYFPAPVPCARTGARPTGRRPPLGLVPANDHRRPPVPRRVPVHLGPHPHDPQGLHPPELRRDRGPLRRPRRAVPRAHRPLARPVGAPAGAHPGLRGAPEPAERGRARADDEDPEQLLRRRAGEVADGTVRGGGRRRRRRRRRSGVRVGRGHGQIPRRLRWHSVVQLGGGGGRGGADHRRQRPRLGRAGHGRAGDEGSVHVAHAEQRRRHGGSQIFREVVRAKAGHLLFETGAVGALNFSGM